MIKTTIKILCFLSFLLCSFIHAQAPWCDGSHYYQNSSLGGYSANNYVIAIEQVRIRENQNIIYNHAADGYSGGTNCGQEYRLSNTPSKAFPLVTGHTYFIDASSSSAYRYYANFGLFIDLNNDKDFLDGGEYLGAWSDANNGPFKQSILKSKEFTIPCNAKLGATRMRLVCNYNVYTMQASYGCTSCSGPPYYGETLDMSIVIDKPTQLAADFIAPSNIWIKTVRNFVNANTTGYINHNWDANNDGTIEQYGKTPDFSTKPTTWTTSGTKCMKLSSTNCLGSDSIVKCFSVNAPTSTPIVDFIASSTSIYQYDVVKLFDLSAQGPWKWEWEIYDSTTYASMDYYPSLLTGDVISDPSGNGLNEFTSTPEFELDVPGCYTVVLRAVNDIGPSSPKIKKCYIKVSLPNNFNLGFGTYGPNGDNYVESASGIIADNGGPNQNYDNDQGYGARSYLCITPCNAKSIRLKLHQLKFKDSKDILRIWDGNSPGGPGTVLLASYNYQSKAPKELIARSGSMFILFESDASGNDSGFFGEYTSELGPASLPVPEFGVNALNLFSGVPTNFYNLTPHIVGLPSWTWSIDGQTVSYNKDLNTSFPSDGNYKVCLEMNSCVGKSQKCSTFFVNKPNTQTQIDILSSEYRPLIKEKVQLTFRSDNANRFEVYITPTTYTLLNPPASPSASSKGVILYNSMPGDSFPIPVIRFDSAACYTFVIKAFNSLDPTNSTKTIVKKDFICAIDYCHPVSYVQTSDISISHFQLLYLNDTLIDKKSGSGLNGYSNFSDSSLARVVHCQYLTLKFSRQSSKDPVRVSAYADWNADGVFNNGSERILYIDSFTGITDSSTFLIPRMNQTYNGKIRLRLIMHYINQTFSPCGPFSVGDVEDYGLIIAKDSSPPVITMLGPDTIFYRAGSGTYVDPGATAYDIPQGDITSEIIMTTDFDPDVTGLYTVNYEVSDCSNNRTKKSRTIIAYQYFDPPVINLNAVNNDCIEAKRDNPDYFDPGATAYNPNPFYVLTPYIITSGSVNTRRVGNYKITYSVQNNFGIKTNVIRNVCVKDRVAPVIYAPNDTNIQLGSIWIDPTEVHDDYDRFPVMNKIWSMNQPVNTFDKTIYSVMYTAYDSSGNIADTVYRNYRVDDFIPPVINLNTTDIVYHEVRTQYASAPVSVTDNYYGPDKTVVVLISSDVNEDVLGTYHEIYKATDGSDNSILKQRTVIVVDRTAPRLWGASLRGCVGEVIWPYDDLYTSDNYYTSSQLKPLIQIISQNVNIWEEGIYQITYRVTDPSGNRSEDFIRYVQYTYPPNCKTTTDINDTTGPDQVLLIYPNPSNASFTIELRGITFTIGSLRISDLTGRILYASVLDTPLKTMSSEILPPGIYIITIETDGMIVRRQLVISR